MYKYVALIAFTAFGVIAFACGSGEKNSNASVDSSPLSSNNISSDPSPSPYDEVTAGSKLYAASCSKCHRADGTGGKVQIEGEMLNPKNLITDKYKKLADEKFIEYIRDGMPDEGMPAFKDKLSQEEIQAVLKFIRVDLQKLDGKENSQAIN